MQGNNISTMGLTSVLLRVASVLWVITSVHVGNSLSTVEDTFSTVEEYLQYCGGCSVQLGDNISTEGNSFSTVEDIQYIGGCLQYMWGITSVQ